MNTCPYQTPPTTTPRELPRGHDVLVTVKTVQTATVTVRHTNTRRMGPERSSHDTTTNCPAELQSPGWWVGGGNPSEGRPAGRGWHLRLLSPICLQGRRGGPTRVTTIHSMMATSVARTCHSLNIIDDAGMRVSVSTRVAGSVAAGTTIDGKDVGVGTRSCSSMGIGSGAGCCLSAHDCVDVAAAEHQSVSSAEVTTEACKLLL